MSISRCVGVPTVLLLLVSAAHAQEKPEIKPQLAVRPLPAFSDLKLQGAEVAVEKTLWASGRGG